MADDTPNSEPTKADDTPMPSKGKGITRRRLLLGAVAATGTALLGTGGYARLVEPYWPEYHEVDLPIANLPAAFAGMRIAHLSDLHAHDGMRETYLPEVIAEVNRLDVDLVAITGDLLTYRSSPIDMLMGVLKKLKAPTAVVFGNHDYNYTQRGPTEKVMTRLLTDMGFTVLRNDVLPLEREGSVLNIVGLEDWWHGRYDPAAAFAKAQGRCSLVLSHNPDTLPHMLPWRPGAVLAGHTHGGQARLPFMGAMYTPVYNKQWDQGLFTVEQTRLYVSRGVGSYWPMRLNCRPDVPIHRLTTA